MPIQRVDVVVQRVEPGPPALVVGRALGQTVSFHLNALLLLQLAKGAVLRADLDDDGTLSNFEAVG